MSIDFKSASPSDLKREYKRIASDMGDIQFFTKKELNFLPEILGDGEQVLAFSSGLMGGHTWLITLTDRRIIFLDKRLIYGLRQTAIDLDKINAISGETGLFFGKIRIEDGARERTIDRVLKTTVVRFTNKVRDAIEVRKQAKHVFYTPTPQATIDIESNLEGMSSSFHSMSEDFQLGVQLRARIVQSIAKGLLPDQRRFEALVGDLISPNQEILTAAVKHILKIPAVINSLKGTALQSAEATLACALKDIEIVYSPAVRSRTAEVARGMLGLPASHRETLKRTKLGQETNIDSTIPKQKESGFTEVDTSKVLLTHQRQSMIMFMGGGIAGLLIMAGIGAFIGLATLRNQPSTITSSPKSSLNTSPPNDEQKKEISSKVNILNGDRSPAKDVVPTVNGIEIDDIADEIFWRKYPQMSGQKLSSRDGALAAEWSQIRRCDAVVDHAFYQLYPSMRGQRIDPTNSEMVATWNQIRSSVAGCQ